MLTRAAIQLLPIRWIQLKHAADRDFATPDFSEWQVYFYGQNGEFPHLLCVVPTLTDPASALPSSSSCVGAP